MFEKYIRSLLEKSDIKIINIQIYTEAFTHRSALNENKNLNNHNERLEFLGDAILELIVTEYLFITYKDTEEGVLTNLRASLVKGETLAQLANELNLGEYIRLSKGENRLGGKSNDRLLANLIEALIAAIYLDSGLAAAKKFVYKYLIPKLKKIINNNEYKYSKSELQQIAQSLFKITPIYKEISSSGPDHNKAFEVAAMIGSKQYGKGEGHSKQVAQQIAAKNALLQIKAEKNK